MDEAEPQMLPVWVVVTRLSIEFKFSLHLVCQESAAQSFEGLSNPLSIRNHCIRHGPSGIGCFRIVDESTTRAAGPRRGSRPLAISARAKSAPTRSRGQPPVPATSQAKQSPKFGPAGWTPLPHRAQAPATRRATVSETAAISGWSPLMSPVISAPMPRRSATIIASATVEAEITIRPLVARASAQAAASGSSGKTAINAEAPTATLAAGHLRHGENPGRGRYWPPRFVCLRHRLHGSSTMTGKHDLVDRLRAADELRQSLLRFDHGRPASVFSFAGHRGDPIRAIIRRRRSGAVAAIVPAP